MQGCRQVKTVVSLLFVIPRKCQVSSKIAVLARFVLIYETFDYLCAVFSINIVVGKFSEFRLQLKNIPEGVQEFEYHLGKQFFVNMESADIHDADLTVRLTVTHKHDIYNLAFHVTGTVTLICDRCLDDLIHPIDATYDIAVKYGDDYSETDELLIIPESENWLNVSYMIFDTASLAIPRSSMSTLSASATAL